MNKILKALQFAAHYHTNQRRSGGNIPYINHPIAVAAALSDCGITDEDILAAAILHDTVEDTDATMEDIYHEFGEAVRCYVNEVTDDKMLPKEVRKQLQIDSAPHKSYGAALIKLADKYCNNRDMLHGDSPDWDKGRKLEYKLWSDQVVDALMNPYVLNHAAIASSTGRAALSRLEQMYRSLADKQC